MPDRQSFVVGRSELERRTLYAMFRETVRLHGDRPAVRFKRRKETEYTSYTYAELDQRVQEFRRGLDALGLRKGDRVALISHDNRVEWAIADLAAQSLGIVTVPIYGSLPAAQVSYYVRDSNARAIVVSDAKQRSKVAEFRTEATDLEFVIAMDGDAEQLEAEGALAFETVSKRGEAGRPAAELDAVANSVDPDDVATLIYTSGTTGDPKGAMLSHINLLHTPDAVVNEPIAKLTDQDTFLSFLPLSHITERVGGHFLPLRVGACITYSQGLSSFGDELTQSVRPDMLLCVPRLWENMHERFRDGLVKMPDKQRRMVEWGLKVGVAAALRRSEGKGIGPLLALQHMAAERLVLSKVRERVTGGRLRYCVSGGAPLDPQAATFFLAIGIQMLEGYGLSETSIITVNRPGKQRIGTVGSLLPEVEMKLAPDGEILTRGPGRMKGYWNKPEATAEAIDEDGWFHTGDVGEVSQDGYLRITDRKKDLIVLTNGKKVAPQPIEALLKHSPFVGEAVLLGDRQSTVMAILVHAFDKLKAWAKTNELPAMDDAALTAHAEVQKLFKAEIERCAPDLADYEKIKRFKLVDKPFTVDGGELTPTLKVKRKFVIQKYADLIASMSR
jgi:long-chain acyl-CoA synthetase